MELSQKQCIPCHNPLPPLPYSEAEKLLGQLRGWTLLENGKWLMKSYGFKDFTQALLWVNRVGTLADQENHHPDIALGWGYVHIRIQTHNIGGLQENDFILAAKIDAIND